MKMPDHTAFCLPGSKISYGELFDRAARLASVLQQHGVRRGDRIGIYFTKSIESVVALYGVMQAGAVYVPLDPGAPTDRTRAVMRQCGARLLISHDAQQGKLADVMFDGLDAVIGPDAAHCAGVPTVPWDEVMTADPAPAFVPGVSEMDLAYIIFTSGSTGVPKGIMHTHRSGLSYSRMAGALYGVGPGDRLASLSPLHFDMSTFDYLCGPQHGASTMIIPDPYTKLPASLCELVQDARLTIWYSVPFALTQMLLYGAMEEHDLSSLRWVLFGGEPFAPKHLAALTERLPQARFSNVYGPAEVNQCTHYTLPPRWRPADGQPPIGEPCAGVDALIVDEAQAVVAAGGMGELIVKSPAVMRGYWGRDALNAKTLIRRPGAGDVDDIWLRTGDLVSCGEDGLLRFHGRADRLVKVRGYRVELDEIEDVMASHPAIEEACAYPVRVDDTLTLIQAAVTQSAGASITEAALLAYVSEKIPTYAIPAKVNIVKEFPRTSSGKIDWKRLGTAAEGN